MDLELLAGVPNDDNREYIPMEIKGTEMTVNENGNNSQVYPKRLRECHGTLGGIEGEWYEYVPESYDGSKAVPLVVSNHGGMMNGWAQAIYSSWTMLAEKEGFICVFPTANTPGAWMIQYMGRWVHAHPVPGLPLPPLDPDDYHENIDMNFVKLLITHMSEKYNIDLGRVFMQGMSMGHGMTDQFARYYGDILAGMAGSAGSSNGDHHYDETEEHGKWQGEVPMWIAHPEWNSGCPDEAKGAEAVKTMKEGYWARTNGVYGLPQIKTIGEHNLVFYKGEKADFTYHDIKSRDHGQTLDEAFLYWNYMFSGLRRNPDGTITKSKTILEPKGDAFAFAVTPNVRNAWLNNSVVPMTIAPVKWQKLKYHGLQGGAVVRNEYLCVSLRFLAGVFGAEYTTSNNGAEATVTFPDGRTAKFARGVIGCMLDNNLTSMFCETLQRDGELLVSVEWFCQFLFHMTVSICDETIYVTDHFMELSSGTAALLRDILS